MSNLKIQVAWRFHNGTKHPNGYLLDYLHTYDPARRPLLYKEYPDLEPINLPVDLSSIEVPALKVVAASQVHEELENLPDFEMLARILHYSAGITKHLKYPPPWGQMAFRAAACTGALYHIELYLACRDLPGLDAGVYHYAPVESALKQLRTGDFRQILIEASGSEQQLIQAPAILIYTHVPWRNACKYQARAYRHAFWDSGTILSHTLAVAASLNLPAKVIAGFIDGDISKLLDLDDERELPVALAAIGSDLSDVQQMSAGLEPISHIKSPVPDEEKFFSAIHEMHQASSLFESGEVVQWREASVSNDHSVRSEDHLDLIPLLEGHEPTDPIDQVITKRGSSRRFRQDPITLQQLSTILRKAIGELPMDFLKTGKDFLNHMYLIVNNVEDLDPGAYYVDQGHEALELLNAGSFREEAGHLALDQDLGRDASVNVYFMTSLRDVLGPFGNRGYRAAQLEASTRAGRIYLASYALGLGATGLTFFDDEVTEFFSPHAKDMNVMFLIAIGAAMRRH